MDVGARAGSPAVAAAAGHGPRAGAAAAALAQPQPPEGSAAAAPRGGRRRGLRVREVGRGGGSGGAVGEAGLLVEGVPGGDGLGEEYVRWVVPQLRGARGHRRRRRGRIGVGVRVGEGARWWRWSHFCLGGEGKALMSDFFSMQL